MRISLFYCIETEKVIKMLQYFWNRLNNPLNGFRSKTSPVSTTGVPRSRFSNSESPIARLLFFLPVQSLFDLG
jgi:hypothetical protein